MTVLKNRGLAGQALNATVNGLVKVEGPAVWNGNGANSISVASDPAFDITGPLCVIMRVRFVLDGFHSIVRKWGGSNSNKSWGLYRSSTSLLWYTNPGTGDDTISLGDATIFDDDLRWFAVTYKPDNGANSREATVWDGGTDETPVWSIHAFNTDAGAAPIQVTTQSIEIIRNFGLRDFQLYDGIGDNSAPGLGTLVLKLTKDNIANTAPDATTIVTATGPDFTVNRATSGPVTTIVPSGVEWVNPDSTAANLAYTAYTAEFDIAANEDTVLAAVLRTGNQTAAWRVFASVGGYTASSAQGARLVGANTADTVTAEIKDASVQATGTFQSMTAKTKPVLMFAIFDQTANVVSFRTYDDTGLLVTEDRAQTMPGAVTPTVGLNVLRNIPGTFKTAMFRKGVGIAAEYTDEVLASMANYLLNEVA